MTRLDDLTKLRADTLARLAECSSDQNFAILGRLLVDTLKQLDELGAGELKVTGLSEFERRLRERESSAKVPRSSG